MKKEEKEEVVAEKVEKGGSFNVLNPKGAYIRTYSGKDAEGNAKSYASKMGGSVRKV